MIRMLTFTRTTSNSIALCSLYHRVLMIPCDSLAGRWTRHSARNSSGHSPGTGRGKTQSRVQVRQRRNWRWASFRRNLTWQVVVVVLVSTIQGTPEAGQPINIFHLILCLTYLTCWHIIVWVSECSLFTSGQKWHNALFWFFVLCCSISIYFHTFILNASTRNWNDFCSKPRLNWSWFPNLKSSFPVTGVDGHSRLQYLGEDKYK
jgi:hypothetical protein